MKSNLGKWKILALALVVICGVAGVTFSIVGVPVLVQNQNGLFTLKSTLAAAVAASDSVNKTIYVMGYTPITGTITVPSTRAVKAVFGGYFAGTGNLVFNGPFEAGSYKVFFNTGSILFGNNAVSEIECIWYGAIADGDNSKATANRIAIQKALDSVSPGAGTPIILSAGTNVIDSKLFVNFMQTLRGRTSSMSYSTAGLRASTGYTDTSLIYINGMSNVRGVTIENIFFEAITDVYSTPGVVGITADPSCIVTYATFNNLFFSTDIGIKLGVYEQENTYNNISMYIGNQVIDSQGNINKYLGVRHSGYATVGDTKPAMYIHDSDGSFADVFHVELINPQAKTEFISMKNVTNFTFNNGIWIEDSNNSGINVLLDNSQNIRFNPPIKYIHPNGKLKLINHSHAYIEMHEFTDQASYIIEDKSFLEIGTLMGAGGIDSEFSAFGGGLIINKTFNVYSAGDAVSPIRRFSGMSGGNLLTNPNFLLGTLGYSNLGVPTFEVLPSTMGMGNMLHMTGNASPADANMQIANVPLLAGVPVTLSGFAKLTSVLTPRFMTLYVAGAGSVEPQRIASNMSGLQHFSYTFTPPTSTTYTFTFNVANLSSDIHAYLSSLQLAYGTSGLPNSGVSIMPTILTADLPAASTSINGTILIEDAGAGNRNLIIYTGGQRFRIDGGANF